ncbi:potassium-transporting ATPase subunit F [Pseudanabaena sp. UWO310]|uniref:potassium-transporting ATPase subunit F n=1 Tax=Pseudanabaena sp. UWO310 TaxID=2480795 RepID=UPI001CC1FFB4|nr:potassium-transporting ATPase subunit F [Pseudanabaena sp. UWO310]
MNSQSLPKLISDMQLYLRKHPNSFRIFLTLFLNLFLAQAVYAAADGNGLTRLNSYAIGLLSLVTVGLAVYLLAVMFQPQRF